MESSVSEATSNGSNVAPKISGKQPMVPRQIGVAGGSKTVSALARRMMSDSSQTRKTPITSNEAKSLRENPTRASSSGAAIGTKSEMTPGGPRRPMVVSGSLDDISTDDTNKDISGASDLPEDQRDNQRSGENTSSDTEDSASSSPNLSLSAMQQRNSASVPARQDSSNRPSPSQEPRDSSQGYNTSRVMLGSRPAAKQKDKMAMEQANKLSVRATENIPGTMSSALMRSRTPNLTQQHQQRLSTAENPVDNQGQVSAQGQPSRRERRVPTVSNDSGKDSSNGSTDSRGSRLSTIVYDPNKPDARPSLRGQDSVDSGQVQSVNPVNAAMSKRSISSSPQQRMRQPLIGQSKVLPAKTNVYSPGGPNMNDPGATQQTRLRSQSAEAVNTAATGGQQVSNNNCSWTR